MGERSAEKTFIVDGGPASVKASQHAGPLEGDEFWAARWEWQRPGEAGPDGRHEGTPGRVYSTAEAAIKGATADLMEMIDVRRRGMSRSGAGG